MEAWVSVMGESQVLTAQAYAAQRAARYARERRITPEEAVQSLRTSAILLLDCISLDEEVEFPVGSGTFYRKVEPYGFTIRRLQAHGNGAKAVSIYGVE